MFAPLQSGVKMYRAYYEGDPTPAPKPGENPPAPKPGEKPPETGSGNPPLEKMIPQSEVNRLLADDKRKLREQNQQLVEQLTQLKQTANLSEQEKADLQARIEQVTATFQTEAETKAIELKNLEKRSKKETDALSSERDSWRVRFERKLVDVEVASAAIEYKAFNAEQLSAILNPITKVVEDLGEDGKPTGSFVTKVDFEGEDKEGKPVRLSLSVKEAVKAMTQLPSRYGNLFRADGAGGIGANPNGGSITGGRLPSLENMTPQDYAKNRGAIRQQMATARG